MVDFVRPDYLVNWLSGALSAHKQGIFHLQMEEGTGKSVLALALDPTLRPEGMALDLDSTTVRSYMVHTHGDTLPEVWCPVMRSIFNRDADGTAIFEGSDLCVTGFYADNPVSSMSWDFVRLFSNFCSHYKQFYGTERLLFVIDGLDHTGEEPLESLIDHLPPSSMFYAGAYLLLLTRPTAECSLQLQHALERLKPQESLLFDRAHPDYRAHPGYRELPTALCAPSLQALGLDPEASGGDLTGTVLAILSCAREPLSLEEIAFLAGCHDHAQLDAQGTSDALVTPVSAALTTLRPLLKLMPRTGGLVFMHPRWRAAGSVVLASRIRELVRNWAQVLGALDPGNLVEPGALKPGLSWLLAEFVALHDEFDPHGAPPGTEFAELLCAAAEGMISRKPDLRESGRPLAMLDAALCIYRDQAAMARVYLLQARAFLARSMEDRALDVANKALQIRRGLYAGGELDSVEALGEAILQRGLAFRKYSQREPARRDYDEALEVLEGAKARGSFVSPLVMARVRAARGNFFHDRVEYDPSLLEYDQAITLFEDELAARREHTDGVSLKGLAAELVQVYKGRAEVWSQKKGYDQALSDYDRAFDLNDLYLEPCEPAGEGKVHGSAGAVPGSAGSVWADILGSRAWLYFRMGRFRESLGEYDRLLALIDLHGTGTGKWSLAAMAGMYRTRGVARTKLGQGQEAVEEFDRALGILDALEASRRLIDKRRVAEILFERCKVWRILRKPEAALGDCSTAIDILWNRYEEGYSTDRNDMLGMYCYRASIRVDQGEADKAMPDLEHALHMYEMMDSDAELPDKTGWGTGLAIRGRVYAEQGRLQEAKDDFDEAIRVFDSGARRGPSPDPLVLADVYKRRGNVLALQWKFELAERDFAEAARLGSAQ